MANLSVNGTSWGNSSHPEVISRYVANLTRELYSAADRSISAKEALDLTIINLQFDYLVVIARELNLINNDRELHKLSRLPIKLTLSQLPLEAILFLLKQLQGNFIQLTLTELSLDEDEIKVLRNLTSKYDSNMKLTEPINWKKDFASTQSGYQSMNLFSSNNNNSESSTAMVDSEEKNTALTTNAINGSCISSI